jgi:hypothetical protein
MTLACFPIIDCRNCVYGWGEFMLRKCGIVAFGLSYWFRL